MSRGKFSFFSKIWRRVIYFYAVCTSLVKLNHIPPYSLSSVFYGFIQIFPRYLRSKSKEIFRDERLAVNMCQADFSIQYQMDEIPQCLILTCVDKN